MGKHEEDEKRERIGLLGSSLSAGAALGWAAYRALVTRPLDYCQLMFDLATVYQPPSVIRPRCLPSRRPACAPEYSSTGQGLWPTFPGSLFSCFRSLL